VEGWDARACQPDFVGHIKWIGGMEGPTRLLVCNARGPARLRVWDMQGEVVGSKRLPYSENIAPSVRW